MPDRTCLNRNLNADVNRWKIFLAVVFGSIVFLSVLGNALVIAAVIFCRKLRKKENSYYASLAMADLLLCCLVMIFAAANDLNEYWSFGGYCKFWMSFDIMCTTSSIGHMCAVAFDRYNHVRNPLVYNQSSSRTKVCLAILSVWILSFLIAFVPLAFPSGHLQNALKLERSFLGSQNNQGQNFAPLGKNVEDQIFDRQYQKQGQKSSTLNNTLRSPSKFTLEPISECFICRLNLSPVYAVVSSSISFFIPCSVMIFVYIKMYRIARRHVTKMQVQMVNNRTRRHSLQYFSGKKTSPIVSLKNAFKQGKSFNSRTLVEQKARITLGIIMGVFLICWLPFFLANIVQSLCDCISSSIFTTLTWLGYANSLANPIIYQIFNKDFRTAFKKILLCQKSGANGSGQFLAAAPAPPGRSPKMEGRQAARPPDEDHSSQIDINYCNNIVIKSAVVTLNDDGHQYPSTSTILKISDGMDFLGVEECWRSDRIFPANGHFGTANGHRAVSDLL